MSFMTTDCNEFHMNLLSRIITEEQEVWGYGCQDYTLVRYVAVALVLTFASFQLLKEVI